MRSWRYSECRTLSAASTLCLPPFHHFFLYSTFHATSMLPLYTVQSTDHILLSLHACPAPHVGGSSIAPSPFILLSRGSLKRHPACITPLYPSPLYPSQQLPQNPCPCLDAGSKLQNECLSLPGLPIRRAPARPASGCCVVGSLHALRSPGLPSTE